MTDRRAVLLDAAIAVLGGQGVRRVTHRAVDAAAGVPLGSTSNHFRSRESLFDAVVIRISERELRIWEEAFVRAAPTTGPDLARLLAELAVEITANHRFLVLARYAILVEAGTRSSLRDQLLTTGAGVNFYFVATLRQVGFADVDGAANLIANYWTGLVLHQLAVPDPTFEPRDRFALLIGSLTSDSALVSMARRSP